MIKHPYGTPEFYAELFSDILADADYDNPKTGDNIVKGFYLAIDDWFKYHENQAVAYDVIRSNVKLALEGAQNT